MPLPSPAKPRPAYPGPAVVLLPVIAGVGLLWWLGWLWRSERDRNTTLRSEITELRLALRASASQESLIADALQRAARLEETLEVMRRTPAPPPAPVAQDPAQAASALELERVISFLREDINAAHETIGRLKQEEAENKPQTTKNKSSRSRNKQEND